MHIISKINFRENIEHDFPDSLLPQVKVNYSSAEDLVKVPVTQKQLEFHTALDGLHFPT